MQLVRRLRIPALFCALAVLLCELIAHPSTPMGVADDGPYILMARTLATTGHIVYNGWAAPMLAWQLYLADALIHLFGFSFTTVRATTLLTAMALAFVFQRTMVRAGISEANATLGTLTLVLSPLYLLLSVTFMTDIHGLFAIVLCLYGCIRALQSTSTRAVILWILFAVATNTLCGTSRQIAWLGLLVIVPSTLWLLRQQRRGLPEERRVLLAGLAINLAGALFILACMHWLKQQPYSIPEHVLPDTFALLNTLRQLFYTFLDLPFFLLPLMVVFFPGLPKASRPVLAALSFAALLYTALAIHDRVLALNLMLLPTHGDWVTPYGMYNLWLQGEPPLLLNTGTLILFTIASIGGCFGLIATLSRRPATIVPATVSTTLSSQQLTILLAPFTLAYTLLLIPRAAHSDLFDRYLLPLLIVALLSLVRYYQEHVQTCLPLAAPLVIAAMAIYGIAITHNTFAINRARVALAAELNARGVPDTSIDNGWDYNLGTELQHAPSINFPTILVPAHFYAPAPPLPAGTCAMNWSDYTPHIHPLYAVSFDPHACGGPAPFAPVQYSRWLSRTPGTLYVVRTTPTTSSSGG